jgi:sulfatase maturation enzyme AslB (radical SAM superfamily)
MNIDVNKLKMYTDVFFDIAGICNASCRYCVTGRTNHPMGGLIDTKYLQQALDILFKNGLVNNKTCFHLYNWGEPTLHPEFGKIINIFQNMYTHTMGGGGGVHNQYKLRQNNRISTGMV